MSRSLLDAELARAYDPRMDTHDTHDDTLVGQLVYSRRGELFEVLRTVAQIVAAIALTVIAADLV